MLDALLEAALALEQSADAHRRAIRSHRRALGVCMEAITCLHAEAAAYGATIASQAVNQGVARKEPHGPHRNSAKRGATTHT